MEASNEFALAPTDPPAAQDGSVTSVKRAARGVTGTRARAEAVWPGRTIDGRYKIGSKLGEGGMGAVYRAEHLALGKEVAIKIILPEFAGDDEAIARFAREATAVARLEHPNIVAAIDYGRLPEGGAYLVTQLGRGSSLKSLIAEKGRFSWREVCEIGAQIADGLHAAHVAGIIHRDLKPENLLVERLGDGALRCKILDFGIARLASLENSTGPTGGARLKTLTRVGTVLGTPGYMAPEQALGGDVNVRSDIYAMAVVLWEALTGFELFDDEELSTIVRQQLSRRHKLASEVVPAADIPESLDNLIAGLLQPDPDQRLSSALSVRNALVGCLLSRGIDLDSFEHESSTRVRLTVPNATVDPSQWRQACQRWRALGQKAIAALRPWQWLGVGTTIAALVALGAVAAPAAEDKKASQNHQTGTTKAHAPLAKRDGTPAIEPTTDPSQPEPEPADATDSPLDAYIRIMLDGDTAGQRRAAAVWLKRAKELNQAPAYAVAIADLLSERRCEDKRVALLQVKRLGNPRAVRVVQELAEAPRQGCGYKKRRDCLACLRDDIEPTLQALGASPTPTHR